MKIVFAHSRKENGVRTGVGEMSRFLLRGLHSRGMDVILVTIGRQDDLVRETWEEWPQLAWPLPKTGEDVWDLSWIENAANWLRQERADVLYLHQTDLLLHWVKAAAQNGIPVVYHVHDYSYFCGRQFLLDGWGNPCAGPESPRACFNCMLQSHSPEVRMVMRFAASRIGESVCKRIGWNKYRKFSTISARAKRSLEALPLISRWLATGVPVRETLCNNGVPREKISLLPHTLTRERFRNQPNPPFRQPGPPRFGFFGRLSVEKGIEPLAKSLQKIGSSTEYHFYVIGHQPKEKVMQFYRETGLPRERFHSIHPDGEKGLITALQNLDMCVMPSLWPEIGPLTLIEALSLGVPCLINRQSGLASLVEHGVNGWIWDGRTEQSLTTLLTETIQHPCRFEHFRTSSLEVGTSQEEYFQSLQMELQNA